MAGYDLHTLIVTTAISSLLGGGLGGYIMRLIMKDEAKKALAPDLKKIEHQLESIQDDYVTCKECRATHNSVNITLADISRKLDLLIENAIKKD